jgi:predicted ester cyclase
MTQSENQALLEAFVAAFNRGDLDAAAELLTTNFFSYVPQSGEPTQPEALYSIGAALRASFPDLHMSLQDVRAEGDELRGHMELRGKNSASLWGAPPNGEPVTVTATMIARVDDGHLALRWEGDTPFVALLRQLRLAPQPENAHLRSAHSVHLPEIVQRLAFNRLRMQEKECSHLDHIKVIHPTVDYCADCAKTGDEYPALRMCVECGYVGCCDQSVNKHMKKHCEETGHPIMRSIQPGEAWLWCYPDSAFLSSRHLARAESR